MCAVAGIPRWHARGQGFKSPQLHQAQRNGSAPTQGRLSADCQQITGRGRYATVRGILIVADESSQIPVNALVRAWVSLLLFVVACPVLRSGAQTSTPDGVVDVPVVLGWLGASLE